MTAFLQAQLPKVYESSVLTNYSKVGFTSHLCSALKTVGMVPLVGLWPVDIIGNPEAALADGIYIFPFDYPDTSTFRVSTTLYRPCFYVALYIGDTSTILNPTRLQNYVLIDDAVRLDGAPTLDNIINKPRARGVSNQGYAALTSDYGSTYIHTGGQAIQKADWLVRTGHPGTDQSLLPVGHWFVYLGPAGLFIYVGSGPARSQFGDLLSFGVLSVGSRIPGRAKPVLEDANLNRINPMVPFPMNDAGTSSEVWNTNSSNEFFNILRTKVHRMQFNDKLANATNTAIVNSYLYNLENVEYPMRPYYGPDTRPSPRLSSSGGGAHILGRVILVPDGLESDANQLFGPLVPELDADDVRPQWEDVFTGEGVRFCDVSAPLGVRIDPITTLDWYLVPTYNTTQLVGLKIEPNTPGTIVDQLSVGTLVQTGDDHYNLATSGYASSFPTPTTVTLTPSSGNFFTAPGGGQDKQIVSIPASSTAATHTVDFDITLNVADPVDTLYRVQVTIRNEDDPVTGTASAEGFNPILVRYFFNGAYVTTLTIECAGTNAAYVNSAGGLSYNLVQYTAYVAKDTTTGTAKIIVRFSAQRDDPGVTTRGSNGEVNNFHILKFRYL